MKLHKGYNTSEVAARYYQKLGMSISRDQAKKNFNLLKHPDKDKLKEVLKEIFESQLRDLTD